VIVSYDGRYYPKEVIKVGITDVDVDAMEPTEGSAFRWPRMRDVCSYETKDIVKKIPKPVPIKLCGTRVDKFTFPGIDW